MSADIEFVPLSAVSDVALISLMTNADVKAHMPLLTGGFTTDDCAAFRASKAALWRAHGYGPWGFMVDGVFAGWGGLQYEEGDADFALVLHPDFWGYGRQIFGKVLEWAFEEKGMPSVTILFPPTRTNARAVLRFGFQPDGESIVGGAVFQKYRLLNPHK